MRNTQLLLSAILTLVGLITLTDGFQCWSGESIDGVDITKDKKVCPEGIKKCKNSTLFYIADSYGCGNNDGVIGCKSDANGINVVCHCDTELCNTFNGRAGTIVAKDMVVVGALTILAVLTRNL